MERAGTESPASHWDPEGEHGGDSIQGKPKLRGLSTSLSADLGGQENAQHHPKLPGELPTLLKGFILPSRPARQPGVLSPLGALSPAPHPHRGPPSLSGGGERLRLGSVPLQDTAEGFTVLQLVLAAAQRTID